jgi:hypothetical protein
MEKREAEIKYWETHLLNSLRGVNVAIQNLGRLTVDEMLLDEPLDIATDWTEEDTC